MRNSLIALVLLMATPLMAEDTARRITVVGQGSIEMVPDMATVSVGVVVQADTGAAAMAQNALAFEAVLAQLKTAGIEARDVQTSNLSLSPRWGKSASSFGGNKIAGFVASNTVTVRVRDLARLGEVLDVVVQSGANSFHGLHFGLQEPLPIHDAARKAAVADALHKAQLYAGGAGVSLGDVLSISDASQRSGDPVMMTMQADMVQSRAVPVAQGEISVGANIAMVFEIIQ